MGSATTAPRATSHEKSHHGSIERTIPGLVVLLGFGLFTFRIMRSGLSGDEAYGASLAIQGLGAVLDVTRTGEPHPPLYYALLSLWMPLAGDSEFALRFLSIASGTLLIPLVYHLGRLTIRGPAALIGSFWAAIHPYHVWYAQEARMYLPIALFSTLSTTLFVHLLTRPSRKPAIGYAATTVLALYTHYYAAFIMLAQIGLALVVIRAQTRVSGRERAEVTDSTQGRAAARRVIPLFSAAVATCVVLYLPWLVAANQLVRSYNGLGPTSLADAVSGTLIRFSTGYSGEPSAALSIGIVVAALALAGLVGLKGSATGLLRGHERVLYFGYAVFPAVATGLLSLARPAFAVRYLLVSDAAFLLLVGAGVGLVWRAQRVLGGIATIGLLAFSAWSLSSYYTDPSYVRSNYGDLVQYIAEHTQPGEGIIVAGLTQQSQFWFYYRHRVGGTSPSYLLPSSEPLDPGQTVADLDRIVASHTSFWFIDTDTLRYDPGRLMEQHLTTHHYLTLERWFGVNRLLFFVRKPPNEANEAADPTIAARFGDQISLTGAAAQPERIKPGEVVRVALEWLPDGPIATDLKVSVRLKDAAGHTVAATDREPRNGFARTSTWSPVATVHDQLGLVVPASVLPGKYQVVVHLYETTTGRELAVADRDGQLGSVGLIVAHLTVAGPPVSTVGDLDPQIPNRVAFGPLRLLGANLPVGELSVGQIATVLLFWEATSSVPTGAEMILTLTDDAGREDGRIAVPIPPDSLPADGWTMGRVIAIPTDFLVPARARSGPHHLLINVVDRDGRPLRSEPLELSRTHVNAPERNYTATQPQHATSHQFGELARLVGFDVDDSVSNVRKAGDVLRVRLHWQAVGETNLSYKTFLHLVGPDGAIHGQRDAQPVGSQRPTTGWVIGEFIDDPYDVALAPEAPPGRYVLRIGLYDEASGQRIPLADGAGDAVDLLTFEVRP